MKGRIDWTLRGTVLAQLGAVLALLAACSQTQTPAPEGVGPSSSARATSTESRPKVDLAAPEPPKPVVVAPSPTPEPAPPASKAAVIGPDIADLGPFDVLRWDEARERAEQRILPENADAEMGKLRAEIEGRP